MNRKISGLAMAGMLLAGMMITPAPASAQTSNKEGSGMPKAGDSKSVTFLQGTREFDQLD